jgi:hypothetical protein
MPYINKDLRDKVDTKLMDLAKAIRECGIDNRAGVLNYSISVLLGQLYSKKYSEINEAVGMLDCSKLEFYRRFAAPYEDTKIKENGDVY